jgi:transcriptional regulator with XRE-family HTH domain
MKGGLMKTNALMDQIRQSTPPEVNLQVEMAVRIANRVYDILEERNMTQRDFAKLVGKSENEVSRWLCGTHNLTLATIAKMSVALGEDLLLPRPAKKVVTHPRRSVNIQPSNMTYAYA